MGSNGKITKKNEITISPSSRKVENVETQQGDFTPYSEDLSEALSAQANLLGGHAQRLSNLIHSEVEVLELDYLDAEKDPKERTRKMSEEQVNNVTRMGAQLLETIRLGVTVTGVRMKVERGESA